MEGKIQKTDGFCCVPGRHCTSGHLPPVSLAHILKHQRAFLVLRKLRGDKCRWLCLNETRFGWNWPIISSVIIFIRMYGNFHIGKIPSRSVCVTLATKQKLKLCWLLGFERFCQSSTYFKLEVLSIKLEVKPSSCIVIFLYAYMIFLLHLC